MYTTVCFYTYMLYFACLPDKLPELCFSKIKFSKSFVDYWDGRGAKSGKNLKSAFEMFVHCRDSNFYGI